MESSKNIINNSIINTEGGDLINGDNNFIQKIIFNLAYNKAGLKSIVKQTKNVLNKIQSDISGHILKRNLTDLPIEEIITNNQFLFIDGEAGSGKSAYAKQILETLDDTCIISFAADQFLKSSLINTLHEINVDLSIEEIFNEFEEFSNKLIYIDSFEKLLEGDAESFRELVAVLKENKDIKLIVSCRSYALETLKFNYFDKQLLQNSSAIINVPQLNDEELQYFVEKIPALDSMVQNMNLAEIIRTPKYLSLAEKLITASDEDLSIIDVVEFKKQLWKNIVGGSNAPFEEQRQNTFVSIAVKRAKNLTLLTTANEFDSETVYRLKSDGVLFEENNLYAPSHDIFEDWGLIKYINCLKIENPKIDVFYSLLTNEPAIRRGFRLWVESKIEESESWIYNFVIDTINNASIENHWKDEVLISIIKSDLCDKFFKEYKDELLEDDLKLLKRVIHLLKISGKDFKQSPNNKGWDVVIKFLIENLNELTEIHTQILRLLYDWENILYVGKITNKETPKYVGKLVNTILNNFDEGTDWMNAGESDSLTEKGIKLLYKLSEYIPEEIKSLLDSLFVETENEHYKIRNRKDKQIEYALSHFHSGTLPKFCADELIALANLKWKYKKIKSESEYGFVYDDSEIEHHFGLTHEYHFNYFPESAYQTFVYKLLKSHPWKALNFIIEITNYCVECYMKSNFLKDDGFARNADDIGTIDILYNGKKYTIHGSSYLWSINRGGQITVPDLLQSIVIALERYLYELGKIDSHDVNDIIQSFFDEIFTKSNSVILLSVVASITMAFPIKVGDKFLPLLSDKYIFDWDRNRWSAGIFGNTLLDLPQGTWEKELCNDERKEAFKWEHRQKYHKGLTGFLLQYQLFHGNLEGRIFEMIDELEKKHNKEDVYFLKLLSEIDSRKQNIEEVEYEGKKVIQISPNYSVDLTLEKEMQRNEEQSNFQNEFSKYSLWVSQTFLKKSEENITYEYWKECFEYYQNYDKSKIDFFNTFPVGTLATLGLDLFSEKLDDKEFELCYSIILEISNKILAEKQKEFDIENFDRSISLYDKQAIYSYLPNLLLHREKLTDSQISDVKRFIFLFIRDSKNDRDINLSHLYYSFRKTVWIEDYQFAYNCFFGLVLYSEFNRKYPRNKRYSDEQITNIQQEENEILNFIENNESDYELINLSFSKFSHWDLDKALHIFPIYKEFDFSYTFLRLIFNAQIDSYLSGNKRHDYYKIGITIRETIINFLFEIPFNANNQSFFENILDIGANFKNEDFRLKYDVNKYVREIVEWFYYKVDSNNGDDKMLNNLWDYWDVLYLKIKNETNLFNQEYLFFGKWKSEADDWFVLKKENIPSVYLKKIENLSYLNIEALMQLLSGIGFQSLMPEGIKILTKYLKSDVKQLLNINYYYGEKLMMRCFKDKIKQIKEDESLLNEFLWFLNVMVDLGSSKAYYIRENLILYKKK
ncbi:hypothetical protein NAL32_08360 [Chryseobacterium sp. Ch-15]|uniref:Novel STAND NTPase 3 domain-containing protein n=1 Tax=Chryseobacterium muglaense TaxID=2893752 RepID=A0A9Q3UYM0_9FLAO|nr:hypothetical protein [Chryseobacterium muglaense]MBD3903034.1 hypothetical protein [Chryseobacterium muglaense]MCC9035866.1 hypothetical protein [Chryseobacterium muglaense]MCM2554405.1 hypothetical protein [Chryseobacterium muglaense]